MRRKRRGLGTVGKGQESAMGKVCLLCMGCLVAGFVGQSIVALLTLNLGETRGEGAATLLNIVSAVYVREHTQANTFLTRKHPPNRPHFLATLLYLNCQHLA